MSGLCCDDDRVYAPPQRHHRHYAPVVKVMGVMPLAWDWRPCYMYNSPAGKVIGVMPLAELITIISSQRRRFRRSSTLSGI
jgi:hypothetical protein